MIDYALAKKEAPRVKAALTKAKNIVNVEERFVAVRNACKAAVQAWERWGAWPDQWSLWQRTLDDAYFAYARSDARYKLKFLPESCPRLEEL